MAQDEYDIIDTRLGQAIRSWAEQARTTGIDLDVQGPLPTPGMDPTWIIRITAPWCDAELLLSAVHTLRSPGSTHAKQS